MTYITPIGIFIISYELSMVKGFTEGLGPVIIHEIQLSYLQGKIIKSNDCQDDMRRDGLFEADVEKVIMEAKSHVRNQ